MQEAQFSHTKNNRSTEAIMDDFVPVDNPTIGPCQTAAFASISSPVPLLDWSEASLSSAEVDWDQELSTAARRTQEQIMSVTNIPAAAPSSSIDIEALPNTHTPLSESLNPPPIVTNDQLQQSSSRELSRRDPLADFCKARLDTFQSNMRFLSIGLRYFINDLLDAHFSGVEKIVQLPNAYESAAKAARKFVASFP